MKPRLKIWCRKDVMNAAKHLVVQLHTLGYEARLVEEIDSDDNAHIYILYCAFFLDKLPPQYIVYQTEVPGTGWWNDHYYHLLRGALAIWDYNAANITHYAAKVPAYIPLSVVTPGVWPQEPVKKDIPILFYGRMNKHRHEYLADIKSNYKVARIEDVFGDEMNVLLQRSRVVLNIHFYPQSPLEVFRVNEALSCGCNVVSESGAGMERYGDRIFVADDAQGMKDSIYHALVSPFKHDLTDLDNLAEIENALAIMQPAFV